MSRPKSQPIEVLCPICDSIFLANSWSVRRGGGKFCSRDCWQASRMGVKRGPYKGSAEPRNCVGCGGIFYVGGRGYAPKDQRFCSNKCSFASRYRTGTKCNDLSVIDAAYIAGFIDGEGSIMAFLRRDCIAIRVSIVNTYRPIIDWIRETCGVGNVVSSDRENNKHKLAHSLLVNAEAAESLIQQIRPYLKIKTAQADLALGVREKLRNPEVKADRSWHAETVAQMKALNRRGPAE